MVVKQAFSSAAEFQSFLLQGRVISLVSTEGGTDTVTSFVTSLDQAVEASNVPSCYFLLEDAATLLRSDVSNLKAFRKNLSDDFGDVSNKAIASNPSLRKAHGDLEVLNGGRSITFFRAADNSPYVEVDGLHKSSTTLLLNEAKTRVHEGDVVALAGCDGDITRRRSTREKLEHVLAHPTLFYSAPAGVIEQLKGLKLKVVVIASTMSFSAEASQACAKLGIHQLSQDGSGFECTLGSQAASL
jgi:hypothetical protein